VVALDGLDIYPGQLGSYPTAVAGTYRVAVTLVSVWKLGYLMVGRVSRRDIVMIIAR
jgi:hypothetical protein